MKKISPKAKFTTGDPNIILDEKDFAVLNLLQQNAKMTVREISSAVHLSPTPVHERIKRMEETGVIKHYVTLVEPVKVGKNLRVICHVSLKEHSKKAGLNFIKSIQMMNEVIECYSISGEFDFLLKVIVRDMETYYDFHVNKLSQVENVGHVQSTFIMGIIKETHQLIFT